jgi:hypothetical protein
MEKCAQLHDLRMRAVLEWSIKLLEDGTGLAAQQNAKKFQTLPQTLVLDQGFKELVAHGHTQSGSHEWDLASKHSNYSLSY